MSTAAQTELFKLPREHANVQWLIGLLKDNGWLTRKEILERINWPATDANLRFIRMIVSAAGPEIVKGQQGFNHITNCKPDEISHAANQAISDGRENIRYGVALRRKAHELVG